MKVIIPFPQDIDSSKDTRRCFPIYLPSISLSSAVNTVSVFHQTLLSSSVSVQFSRSVVSDSLQPHGLQHTRPPCPSLTPGVHPNSCPLSWWCHPTISSLSSPSPPALNLSQHQGLFKWVRSSHQVAKVLEFQLQHHSFDYMDLCEQSDVFAFSYTV